MAALRFLRWALEAAWLAVRARRPDEAAAPKSLLVLGYAAIGDMVFLLPLLEGLRARFPGARIVFLCTRTPITEELVPATGLVDEIIAPELDWPLVPARERRRFMRELRARRFDAVLLTLSAPAHFFQPALASIPVRVGHCTELVPPARLSGFSAWAWKLKRALVLGEISRRLLLTRKVWVRPDGEHAAVRNGRLLEALGGPPAPARPKVPVPPRALERASALLGPKPAGTARVGVHLGAPRNPYRKIWPAQRMGALCRLLEADGAAQCVLLGGPEELENVEPARRAAGRELTSLVGRCSLLESFAALSLCDLVVSSDTGLAKAAIALGVPTATIWGPTGPDELGALWEPEKHLDIQVPTLPCQPCVRLGMAHPREGTDFSDCRHHDCLGLLTPESAAAALRGRYGFLKKV